MLIVQFSDGNLIIDIELGMVLLPRIDLNSVQGVTLEYLDVPVLKFHDHSNMVKLAIGDHPLKRTAKVSTCLHQQYIPALSLFQKLFLRQHVLLTVCLGFALLQVYLLGISMEIDHLSYLLEPF